MGGKTIKVYGFPMNVTADGVKNFLKKHTGDGSVFALKVRHPRVIKTRSRAYAVVQVLTIKDAEIVYSQSQLQYFSYQGSYLKVEYLERDIVPRPRKQFSVSEDAVLHLGCLISEETLGVLWSCEGVNVHFGSNMKKIHFLLTQGSQSYKLELSYESIWDIQLYCPRTQCSKFLVIQSTCRKQSKSRSEENDHVSSLKG